MDIPIGHTFGYPGAPYSPASVDPGGRLWFDTSDTVWPEDWDEVLTAPNAGCAGLVAVDGGETRHFLEEICNYHLDIDRDGNAWLQAGFWGGGRQCPQAVGPVETYVILPEAVAAAE